MLCSVCIPPPPEGDLLCPSLKRNQPSLLSHIWLRRNGREWVQRWRNSHNRRRHIRRRMPNFSKQLGSWLHFSGNVSTGNYKLHRRNDAFGWSIEWWMFRPKIEKYSTAELDKTSLVWDHLLLHQVSQCLWWMVMMRNFSLRQPKSKQFPRKILILISMNLRIG